MFNDDPFERLGLDCREIVLTFLRPEDLIRCEGVSRLWQTAARSRMARDGARLGPSSPPASKEALVKRFKHFAAREASLQHGRASSVRRFDTSTSSFTRPRSFAVAGDYVAWKTRDGLLWQTLRFTSEGSVSQPQTLTLQDFVFNRPYSSEVANILLNEAGCLFFRASPWSSQPRLVRDRIFCLVTGRVLWHQDLSDQPAFANPPLIPLLLGKDRVYFTRTDVAPHRLIAHDFRNAQQLYDMAVDSPKGTLRDWYDVVDMFHQGGEEFLIHITKPYGHCVVTLYHGKSGQVAQKFEHTGLSGVTFLTQGTSKGFTLMANIADEESKLLLFFTKVSDGSFAHTGTEAVWLEAGRAKFDEMDIDPDRLFLASFSQKRPIPKIWTLEECHDSVLIQQFNELLLATNLPHSVLDQLWKPVEPHEIDLPPAPRGKKRRRFCFNGRAFGSRLQFLDGQRLSIAMRTSEVVESMAGVQQEEFEGVYIFDFTPRKHND